MTQLRTRHHRLVPILAATLLAASIANAQVAQPADFAKERAAEAPTTAQIDAAALAAAPRLRSFEMPALKVVGEDPNPENLRSEDRIGSYGQPRWTATRRFPNTRVYVVPEGKIEVEYWLQTRWKDDSTNYRNLFEVEVGLPYRLQLDLYLRLEQDDSGPVAVGESIEMRYALADWDVIPGNPTLYFEWTKVDDEPDALEAKLLLGGQIAPRWHWGANLSTEWQLGGDLEREWRVTGGLSYTVIDRKLSVGAEAVATWVDAKDDRGDFTQNYLIGPSIQFRPLEQMTVNVVGLVGFGPDDPNGQLTINLGYEF